MRIGVASVEPVQEFALLPDRASQRVLLNGCIIGAVGLIAMSWIVTVVQASGTGTAIEFTVFASLVLPALTIAILRAGFGTLALSDSSVLIKRGVKGVAQTAYPWKDLVSAGTGVDTLHGLPGTTWLMSLAGIPVQMKYVELRFRSGQETRAWPLGRGRSQRLRAIRLGTPTPAEVLSVVNRYLA